MRNINLNLQFASAYVTQTEPPSAHISQRVKILVVFTAVSRGRILRKCSRDFSTGFVVRTKQKTEMSDFGIRYCARVQTKKRYQQKDDRNTTGHARTTFTTNPRIWPTTIELPSGRERLAATAPQLVAQPPVGIGFLLGSQRHRPMSDHSHDIRRVRINRTTNYSVFASVSTICSRTCEYCSVERPFPEILAAPERSAASHVVLP